MPLHQKNYLFSVLCSFSTAFGFSGGIESNNCERYQPSLPINTVLSKVGISVLQKMNTKISINLESESIKYLDSVTTNRSAYINQLIKADLKKLRDRQLEQAYIDQENDPEFHREKQLWECVSGDGLEEDA